MSTRQATCSKAPMTYSLKTVDPEEVPSQSRPPLRACTMTKTSAARTASPWADLEPSSWYKAIKPVTSSKELPKEARTQTKNSKLMPRLFLLQKTRAPTRAIRSWFSAKFLWSRRAWTAWAWVWTTNSSHRRRMCTSSGRSCARTSKCTGSASLATR